jgi:hypothetical protein
MSGYSGTASFEFEIERYKDKESGELLTHEKVNPDDDGFEFEYQTFTLQVEGRSYFAPGRCYGPPENCYPDEGETEIESVLGPDGKDWEDKLTSEERESILTMIDEQVQDQEPDVDEDDYDDDDRFDFGDF